MVFIAPSSLGLVDSFRATYKITLRIADTNSADKTVCWPSMLYVSTLWYTNFRGNKFLRENFSQISRELIFANRTTLRISRELIFAKRTEKIEICLHKCVFLRKNQSFLGKNRSKLLAECKNGIFLSNDCVLRKICSLWKFQKILRELIFASFVHFVFTSKQNAWALLTIKYSKTLQ